MTERTALRIVEKPAGIRERATEMLRSAILDLTFKPGEPLVERRLCEETGVSRTSIRESLRILEAEGLVHHIRGKGLCVTEITSDDVRAIYEVRGLLEGQLLRKIAEAGRPEDAAALHTAVEALSAFSDPEAENAAVGHAIALGKLSEQIADSAGNRIARDILVSLSARMTYIRAFVSKSATIAERERTLELLRDVAAAVVAGDADRAETSYRLYIDRAATRAVDLSSRAASGR